METRSQVLATRASREDRTGLARGTSSVTEHYENLLGPIYVWMTGGIEAALQSGGAEIEALNLPVTPGAVVLDLGAGFGMHSIPLARRGARVTAIDASPALLRTLTELRGELPIDVVHDDLLAFRNHVTEAPSTILSMGDTITHLPSLRAIETPHRNELPPHWRLAAWS